MEASLVHRQESVLQFALLLLILNLGFDHVGTCYFAAALQLLADTEKAIRFRSRFLGGCILALRDDVSVVSLHDGDDQTACPNLRFGARQSFRRLDAPIFRKPSRLKRRLSVA